jgi:hypothetical protein
MDPITMGLVSGGISALGGLFSSNAQKKAAEASANAQLEAARIAAEASRFKPVAVTTGFGGSKFTTDDKGNVVSAGYELTPEMQNLRNQIIQQTQQQGLGFTQQGLGAAQGLFGLGQQYLAETPEQAAQKWMQTQQAALSPSREQAMSGLMNRLTQTGTQGLGVSQAGGGQSNPLMQAFANAQAQQDLDLAARAQAEGRSQTEFGKGLLSGGLSLAQGAYAPLNTMLQQAGGIEGLGQESLKLGAELGGRNVNTTGANALFQAGTNAAQALQKANEVSPWGSLFSGAAQNPQLISGLTNAIGNWNQGYNVYTNDIMPTNNTAWRPSMGY